MAFRSTLSLRTLCALMAALALPAQAVAPTLYPTEAGPRAQPSRSARTALAQADTTHARVIVKYRSASPTSTSGAGTLARETIASVGAQGLERPQLAQRMSARLGRTLKDGIVVAPRVQVLHASGLSSAALAAQLAADPNVEYAEVDQRAYIAAVPTDPLYAGNQPTATPTVGQWYLRAPTTTTVSAINAEAAWATSTGAGVVVAVLDTGVRLDHPDLAGKLLPGYDFISDTTIAGDGGGRDTDPSDPGDWTAAGECAAGDPAYDSSWHGTQVAGLIAAAANNGIGLAGTAHGAKVLPVRVLGRCGGYQSDIVAAMRWAAGISSVPYANPNPAKVVNLSLGSAGTCSSTYQSAVNDLAAAGVSVVVAAGNDAGLAANQPANCTGAIGVAGVRHVGSKVGYSNVGSQLTIAAPAGNCVNLDGQACLYPLLTTLNSGTTTPGAHSYSDSSNASLGTSFATPLVSGTVAMMLAVKPSLTPANVKTLLVSSARAFPPASTDAALDICHSPDGLEQAECHCTTSTCGAGMLDTAAAVAAVALSVGGNPLPMASSTINTSSPYVGSTLTLNGMSSAAAAGIATYQWEITSGDSLARLSNDTSSVASLAIIGTGTIGVKLTIMDNAGRSSSVADSITIEAPVSTSSGGGAMGWGWLLGLGLAVLALAWPARRAVRDGGC